MSRPPYLRSPKVLVGGLAHFGRLIDKIRLRHTGHIQDYNYLTVGFDQSLIEFVKIDPKAFERRVLEGGTDTDILEWVYMHGCKPSDAQITAWSHSLLSSGPQDEAARQRFQGRLQDIANQRGVSLDMLPPVSTWADVIELDEGRL